MYKEWTPTQYRVLRECEIHVLTTVNLNLGSKALLEKLDHCVTVFYRQTWLLHEHLCWQEVMHEIY